jgi:hypothetical protein
LQTTFLLALYRFKNIDGFSQNVALCSGEYLFAVKLADLYHDARFGPVNKKVVA